MLCDVFIEPLQRQGRVKHMDIVSSPWVATVFSNVQQILPIHEKLLRDLTERLSFPDDLAAFKEPVATLFVCAAPLLEIYKPYAGAMVKAFGRVSQMENDSQAFASFLKQHAVGSLSLGDLILLPVERLYDYPVALRELLSTLPSGHSSVPALTYATTKMTALVSLALAFNKKNNLY
jgi:hypothetical protein